MKNNKTLLFFLFVGFFSCNVQNKKQLENSWKINDPIFSPGLTGTFDEISVKDPSIVFFENAWHLFYTARSQNEYTTGYVSANTLEELNVAKRHELKMIRGKSRYGCAPQVFFFEPQKKWYLIFQNRDSNYQPVFSINADISKPEKWSNYKNLIKKEAQKKWIDFWVISDRQKVYLFYTEGHSGVMVRFTSMEDFPGSWSESKKVFDNVHEAVHIYKVKGKREFHMVYEVNTNGVRSFGMASAKNLEGPWKKITANYATGDQLKYKEEKEIWTEMVSHGEAIRSGYNELMEYEPENCRWLIQGILKKELNKKYINLPWKLGVIKKLE